MAKDKPFVATICARCAKCGEEVARCETPIIDAQDQDEAKKALIQNLKEMRDNGDLVWDLTGINIHLVSIDEHPEAGPAPTGSESVIGEFEDAGGFVVPPDDDDVGPPPAPQRRHSREDD